MPRHHTIADGRRHLLPLPPEQRELQPFLLDARRRRVFGSWPRKRAAPGDEERMFAALDSLADVTLPDWLCWIWADGRVEPVRGIGDGWLGAWERDHDCYRVE